MEKTEPNSDGPLIELDEFPPLGALIFDDENCVLANAFRRVAEGRVQEGSATFNNYI